MAPCVGAAATLAESNRKDLAIQALARSATISGLSVRHGVSRKFVYQQAHKACAALDDVFLSGTPEEGVPTYCYLLVAAEHRDADTWGVHLLDASAQGLKPDYTIADAGKGLRAGQKAAWDDTPCYGDVFHITRQYEGLANTLSRLAKGAGHGARSWRPRSAAWGSLVQTTNGP